MLTVIFLLEFCVLNTLLESVLISYEVKFSFKQIYNKICYDCKQDGINVCIHFIYERVVERVEKLYIKISLCFKSSSSKLNDV
jgi:uncharacterized protein (DUF302 family)